MRTRPMALALAGLASLLSTTVHADFRSALKAYAAGHYDAAHAQFFALAQLGDGASQFNLGAMALQGQGGPKDPGTGVGWVLAAVDNGFQGPTPEQLAAMQSKLTDDQRRAAQDVMDHYGHAALLRTVLPATDHKAECPGATLARAVQLAPADYPLAFRRGDRDGIEIIEVTVGLDGLASDPEILMAVPTQGFTAPAIESLLRSRFRPGTRGGVPAESRTQLKYIFSMIGGGSLWDVGALRKVRDAAAAGDPNAQYLTGLAGTLDSTVGISPAQARQLLLSAAQGGEPDAQYQVARRLEALGRCGEDSKRRVWLQAAATSGDASAQLALASDLLQGTPSVEEANEARSLLEQAARSERFYVRKHVAALMASSPLAAIRDPRTALAVAKKLAWDPVPSDPQMFEVIAAAYAANGVFAFAVSNQEKAVQRATELYWNTSMMEARLAAYRSLHPWSGDLFSLPPASEAPPALTRSVPVCTGGDSRCRNRRQAPDRPVAPAGSRIPQ